MQIASLHIHPVKSLKGLVVDEVAVARCGFEFDRQWIVVDDDDRRVSARKCTKLATIGVNLASDELILSYQHGPSIRVPVSGGTPCNVRLGDSAYDEHAHRADRAVAMWLTEVLGFDCSLVRLSSKGRQALVASPIHLISMSSVVFLNQHLNVPISAERFRANVVVQGFEPFAEDRWNEIRLGDVRMRVLERTSRCSVPNIDPITGNTEAEPLRTLAKLRRVDKRVEFGIYLAPLIAGRLSRGASVTF